MLTGARSFIDELTVMPLFFQDREALAGSSRDVTHVNYRTFRLLIAADGAPVSLTDIVLNPGIEDVYGYPDRTEVAYCIEGHATVHDLQNGRLEEIRPGKLWVAPPGSRFRFVAHEATRLICVFDPPLTGNESGLADEASGQVFTLPV